MYKEVIISIVIIIVIIIGNNISQGYTNSSIEEINRKLSNVREQIYKSLEINVKNNKGKMKQEIEAVIAEWEKRYYLLAIYIEHDELEKVKKELVSLKASIDVEEYQDAIGDVDRCTFALEHLKEKEVLNVDNFF